MLLLAEQEILYDPHRALRRAERRLPALEESGLVPGAGHQLATACRRGRGCSGAVQARRASGGGRPRAPVDIFWRRAARMISHDEAEQAARSHGDGDLVDAVLDLRAAIVQDVPPT
jgi:hypothetical protein